MLPRQKRRFNRTTLLSWLCLAFLGGLALSRFGRESTWFLTGILLIFVFAAWKRRAWMALVVIVLLGASIGLIRGGMLMEQLEPYHELYGQKVVLQVVALEDATYDKNAQLSFDTSSVQALKPLQAELPGRVKVSGFGESMIYRGDVVEVEGKLYKPLGGRMGQVSYAALNVQAHRSGVMDQPRREFAAGMQSALPEPAASFGLGLLVGQRSTLPDVTADQLAMVGLTHIIAVSGYNLTIIVQAVRRTTAKLSKYQGTVIALGLLGLFLLATGMSAPIVRASIVSGLTIWAWYYGRQIKPLLLIAFAAAVTACWNPLYLWSDLGWYLSFLAFFGVLVLAPLIMRRLYGDRRVGFLHAILIETVCAQVMTLPLILYIFQETSVIAVMANLLLVPFVPLAMLLSLIAGVSGAFVPFMAGWFAWPAVIILTYILDMAGLLSRMPGAMAQAALSLSGLVWLYVIIVAITAVLWRKVMPARGILNRDNGTKELVS